MLEAVHDAGAVAAWVGGCLKPLRETWVRRSLTMAAGAGNTPERTHQDGYEGTRVATTPAETDKLRATLARRFALHHHRNREDHRGEGV